MFFLKRALSCQNMFELSAYNTIYTVNAFSWYIQLKYHLRPAGGFDYSITVV
jgi:hypothetical protein